MNNHIRSIDPHCPGTEFPIFIYQTLHHQAVRPKQIINRIRIQSCHQFICLIRIFHFLNLIGIP